MRGAIITFLVILSACFPATAQYPPPAGQPGSTAIWRDSSIFANWAKHCVVERGWQNITDTTLGKTTVGDGNSATGKPGENGIVSLGDGGWVICTFEHPLKNGPGADFAVFENSFNGLFLELAFVEVSSNGSDFFRFPAHSLTDTLVQKGTFDVLDATQLNNLAGKYAAGFGTPFDLQELAGTPGLDLNHITHIKVIDVVGSLDNDFATRDAFGNKVNDPFPTPFQSGGFDLDAVGVIHQNEFSHLREIEKSSVSIFPNPAKMGEHIHIATDGFLAAEIFNHLGQSVFFTKCKSFFFPAHLSSGIYTVVIHNFFEQRTLRLFANF